MLRRLLALSLAKCAMVEIEINYDIVWKPQVLYLKGQTFTAVAWMNPLVRRLNSVKPWQARHHVVELHAVRLLAARIADHEFAISKRLDVLAGDLLNQRCERFALIDMYPQR